MRGSAAITGDLDLDRARREPAYLRLAMAFIQPISDVHRARVMCHADEGVAPKSAAEKDPSELSRRPDAA